MIVRGQPYVKRIGMPVDFRTDITRYGKSNLYPQMVEQILFRSSTSSQAVEGLKDFTVGEGFENNGDTIVNRHEQSIDQVMAIAAQDFSLYDGFALHFNVNELMQITEITNTAFKNVRYGLPDEMGIHHDVKINNNWENDQNKTLIKKEIIFSFPLWNRREGDFIEDVDELKGFILYYTPTPDDYPKSTLDPVLDSAQTDAEIQIFELSSIQSGFIGTSIFRHPGKIQSKEEKLKVENDLRQLQGSENANSIMVVETPPNFEAPLIENIAGNDNDRRFELTNNNVVARIMANYAMPYAIAGIQPPNGGIFNQEQMKDSMIYFNAKTRGRRIIIADQFNRIMESWVDGAVDLGAIVELEFDEEQQDDGGEDTNNSE